MRLRSLLFSFALVLTYVFTAFSGSEAQGRASVASASWGHARIVERDGDSIFEVDGKPFFLYGAAFFYERLPRDMWAGSMAQLKSLGINTLDLYVPWNWHELADGDFDFNGRTSPRRDFDEVLRLAKKMDFKIVLRPGPVVRNEWRNGGYPAWLLSRPEYGMPLHDLLEGRYPPTATLQNQHSDDAAAAWMRNATHVTYAKRWIERVLRETAPYADRILAVALDDDQGAYIDNQTYPAPHFQAYIQWLRDVVHGVTGNDELTFINTYQMKVTASSPVWAMGNWYQSDAYSIGEHDLSQLAFSTSLLHTRPHQPMFASEFQAGWLEEASDSRPRPADASNTILADATMLGLGVRGIVNFPAQDTLNPPGWEAPWANVFYAWDAALSLDNSYAHVPTERAIPTARFGALVTAFGPALASATQRFDAAIVYLGGSVDPDRATNERFSSIASATIDAQKACRDAQLSCTLVDPSAIGARDLARFHVLVVPDVDGAATFLLPSLEQKLIEYARAGGIVARGTPTAATLAAALGAARQRPILINVPGGTFLRSIDPMLDGFLSITNYSDRAETFANGRINLPDGKQIRLPMFSIAAHDALVTPIDVRFPKSAVQKSKADRIVLWDRMPLEISRDDEGFVFGDELGEGALYAPDRGHIYLTNSSNQNVEFETYSPIYSVTNGKSTFGKAIGGFTYGSFHADYAKVPGEAPYQPIRFDAKIPAPTFAPVLPDGVLAYPRDIFRDGSLSDVLDNGLVRLSISPQAGGRIFSFVDDKTGGNVFTTVGAVRDDVAIEPPLSTVDKIAKYTHDMPAGTFNRTYDDRIETSGDTVATVDLRYDAPDVLPAGATFVKRISLRAGERSFGVDESFTLDGSPAGDAQRAVSVSSLSVGCLLCTTDVVEVMSPDITPFRPEATIHVTAGHAIGLYTGLGRQLGTIAWRAGDIDDATILEQRYSMLVRLTIARGKTVHVRYGYETPTTTDEAQRLLAEADAAAQIVTPQVSPTPARTP